MIVLSIDPGNYKTGFSVFDFSSKNFPTYIISGVIKSNKRPENLKKIYLELEKIINKYNPKELALEASFYGKNPQSLIRLGEVRGIILLLSSMYNIPIFEYTPQQVKNAITGYGWSDKLSVLKMVEKIFNLRLNSTDEADAIAIGFCHFINRK
ncbi:MAG TPA: crossover junction endodeoxyribonuclease RuvC [Hydrogenothermaceae bacterium]|nr:crossover junction endodeoxyribonuclease RuvC [Hydrogenothermaceae bacterium]